MEEMKFGENTVEPLNELELKKQRLENLQIKLLEEEDPAKKEEIGKEVTALEEELSEEVNLAA